MMNTMMLLNNLILKTMFLTNIYILNRLNFMPPIPFTVSIIILEMFNIFENVVLLSSYNLFFFTIIRKIKCLKLKMHGHLVKPSYF